MVSKIKPKKIKEYREARDLILKKVVDKKALPPGYEHKVLTEEEKEEMIKKKHEAWLKAKIQLNKTGGK